MKILKFGISKEVAKNIFGSDWIQKSKKGEQKSDHKYIWRVPKDSGEGYDYIYEDDQVKRPLDMLLKFFKITKATISKIYKDNNIESDYKATENQFASHVLEYETNKSKWDKLFSNVTNSKVTKNPKTMAEAKKADKKEAEKKGKEAVKKLEEKKFVPNRTLMRKIWAVMNPEKAKEMDITIANMDAEKSKEVIGNSVPLHFNKYNELENVKVGDKVTLGTDKNVYEVTYIRDNGFVDLKSSKGIVFGRIKNNPTEENVVETQAFDESSYNDSHNWDAERLAKEKKVAESYGYNAFKNGAKRAISNDELFNNYLDGIKNNNDVMSVEDHLKGVKSVKVQLMEEWYSGWDRANIESAQEVLQNDAPVEETTNKPGFTDVEKYVIALAYKKEKNFDPTLSDYDYYEKIKEKMPELAEKGELYSTMLEVKDMMLNDSKFQAVKEYLESLKNQESEQEEHENRSEAMLGNQNAKGKHNVKPQTESEMKSEQKKEKENRKKAGLRNPGNNVGDRVSAIDDIADSWDPNSENYRFKDTGYIAGSRKELASMFIMERAKGGYRIDAREIDFDGLEENPRAAEKLITKSNIFGEVNWDELKSKGMSGSAAFLIDRIYASAGTKPDESNANARKQYVIALNGLRDRFEDCKTVPEVIDTLKEIRDEMSGEFVEIKETAEYKQITDKMKSLKEIVMNKRIELDDLSDQGRKTYEVEHQKVVEKYIQKGKDAKLLRWNTRNSKYNIPKEYQADFEKDTKDLWDKAYAPWKKGVADFKAELISRGVKEEDFMTGKKNYAGQPIAVSWYDYYTLMPEATELGALSSELDAYIKKMKVAVSLKNPLLEAWKSLGPRFTKILSSDSFAQHRYDCTKGKYDDWGWMEKEVKVTEKTQGKEKKKFQLLVANQITRKGGRDFNITSTADLKKAFNLREVQSGNWVLKDPASAEFHVRNAANAFADLADITGISDDKISLNGRLAMAFGARGKGNAGGGGAAAAHYEPVERVINLTKFNGGGSLGHEWFHALDNMITSAMTGDDSTSKIMLTNLYHGMTDANKELLKQYVDVKDLPPTFTNEHRKRNLEIQLKKKGIDVSKLNRGKSALQFKVQAAFDDLVKAMTEGDSDLRTRIIYEGKDYKNMLANMSESLLKRYRESYSSYSGNKKPIQLAIADAGSLDEAVNEINKRYESYSDAKSVKNKRDWVRIAAAYYDRKPDGNKHDSPLLIKTGEKVSKYLADAREIDLQNGGVGNNDYWATTHEMAARAFSAYLEDSLDALGRKNDYLAYASDNKFYEDNPYPEGEERKRINAAFKKLFEVINSEQAIQKAIDILDCKKEVKKSVYKAVYIPQVITNGKRILIRNSVMKSLLK